MQNTNTIYDLIIIGGGPAGVAAGVYASRKKLRTLFITADFLGQSSVSDGIENWIGTIKISGADLSKDLEAHLRAYAGDIVDIKTGQWVKGVKNLSASFSGSSNGELSVAGATSGPSSSTLFEVTTKDGAEKESTYQGKTVLITTGSTRRKLPAKNADVFEHKGLTYCATCDGPIFSGQDVAVIGGGNAAFESAAQLAAYCKSVTIVNRTDKFRADPVTVEKVCAMPNVNVMTNIVVEEILGDKFVNGFTYKKDGSNTGADALETLPVTGIFVEIGLIPNTSFAKDVVEIDAYGKIAVDPRSQQTKTAGVWAAGDCTDGLYHQNNIAAGDAVKALEDIYVNLFTR
jgi:NADH-dependent peroxiredoxin subunit F